MATNIHLTPTERFSLANQLRIRALLSKKKDDADYLERQAEALENGYTALYRGVFENIYDELPEDECRFVGSAMDMFWSMQHSYGKLKDKGGLKEDDVRFPGFSGNDEARLLLYAEFMVEKLDKFNTMKYGPDGFNSHFPMTDRYSEMLSRFKPLFDKQNDLSAVEIKNILGK